MTVDILLSQAIEGFLLARLADGYSPASIAQYRWGLNMLVAKIDKPLSSVDITDLRRFMAGVQQSELSPVSISHVWKAIRAFYKWTSAEGMTERPDHGLAQPKFKLPEVVPFSVDETKALLKACDRTAPANGKKQGFTMARPSAVRDKAMLLLLLDTGLRASELCRLKVEDVDLKTGIVLVRPYRSSLKSRPRTTQIGSNTRKFLWKYLAVYEIKSSDFLFHSTDDDGPMNRSSLFQLFARLGDRAGVVNCHPHRFRHTFAITFLRNGGDVFSLQRMLGHSSLEMVRHYLALAEADDKEAHRRASPVDNWKLN